MEDFYLFEVDFYLFEVLEEHIDTLAPSSYNNFIKGSKFIGWEWDDLKVAVKSNMNEIICIPLFKVKKLYKINFEEI